MVYSIGSKMFPTKNALDYMTEMNLYPKTGFENDMFQTPSARTNSFSHSTVAHSSSSAETSPDSFPDLTPQLPPEFRSEEARRPSLYQRNPQWRREFHENQLRTDYDSFQQGLFEAHPKSDLPSESLRSFETHPELFYGPQRPDMKPHVPTDHMYETPLIARRQRPIIGRKIMAITETPVKTIDEFPTWQPNMPHTPPKSLDKYTPNIYELFPSEQRGFDFPSPVKTPHTSPQLRMSPRVSSPRATHSLSPTPQSFTSRMPTPFKEPFVGPSMSFNSHGSAKMCTFCRKNGETPVVYMTHTVKEKVGNKNVVTCPILRSHVCSTCGASGDNAHTITYCPVLRSGNNGQPLQSTTITLKNTRIKSNGRRRY